MRQIIRNFVIMALNKANGNMYTHITHTWNPLGGECFHKCGYCSTHKLVLRYPVIKKKYSGPPRLDEKCMRDQFNDDMFIFVVAQNDLFAWGVPGDIILSVLEYCRKFNCKYLFQTKNPVRILDYLGFMPKNSTICTTIESDIIHESMKDCPRPEIRSEGMNIISKHFRIFVTIEPVMDFNLNIMTVLLNYCNPNMVSIGADSGNNHLPEPSKEKLLELIYELQKFTIIDQKRNLNRILNQ